MSLSNNYPNLRPSLLLDFANTKTLDPRITFTRASTGTFYDGKTVAKAEENLLRHSQEFDNAIWTKSRASVVANATTAPDGTTTAEKLVEDTSSSTTHRLWESVTVPTIGLTYTFSIFAKKEERSQIFIRKIGDNADTNGILFDLDAGTFTVAGSGSTGSIASVGNGWYRCTLTATAGLQTAIIINLASGGAPSYTGDGTSGAYIWGAQLEQRSSVTAYTPTTTAPITNYIPALQTAAAGVARFEHNPVTGESLGLEIEEQRTNLLTYSEQFDNAIWAKVSASVSANTTIAPDGNLSADLLTGTGSGQRVTQSVAVTGTTASFSVYVKAPSTGTFSGASLLLFNNTNPAIIGLAKFSGSTFTLDVPSLVGAATSTLVGNGWYRITVTNTTAFTSGNTIIAYIYSDNSAGTGANASVNVWGAQLEAGSFATSYIPTVASQVTRSADSASMTGTNFSSWYRADEGTLYSDIVANSPSYAYTFSDGTGSNYIVTRLSASGSSLVVAINNNTVQANIGSTALTSKVANTYKVNDFATSVNGGAAATDTSGAIPIVNQVRIGASMDSTLSINGTIKKVAYYPKRLTNQELVGLTTV